MKINTRLNRLYCLSRTRIQTVMHQGSANLQRFINAQEKAYEIAFSEIKNGRKASHWMWFIFPQIRGLGNSEMAEKYAIKDLQEAEQFLKHPLLGERLINISRLLIQFENKSAHDIFGYPDDLKLKSCMTLFSAVQNPPPIFQQIIDQYFDGSRDEKTLRMITS